MLREGAHDLVAFAQAQQSMIHEHTHQLIADGAVEEGSDHRGVHATGQSQQYLALADLCPHARHSVFDDVAGAPQGIAAADLADKPLQQARALGRVGHLGVELHAVEAAALIAHRGKRNGLRCGVDHESCRQGSHAIAVAHPYIKHCTASRGAAVGEVIREA